MKKTILSCFIILVISSNMNAQLDTVFFEGFSASKPSWTKDTDENSTKVENGNYIWTRKQAGEWNTWWTVDGINPDEFEIETRFKISGNGALGLVWGSKDVDNTNYFIVNKAGDAKTYLESRNNTSIIHDHLKAALLPDDFNTLTIRKKDNRLSYLVNGVEVDKGFFPGFFGDHFGLSFQDASTYYIDYLLIKHKMLLSSTIIT